MILRPEELKARALEAGKTAEDLAEAVAEVRGSFAGKTGERLELAKQRSLSAVRNWLGGRNTPRCGRADIDAMAAVVGCEPKDIGRFTSRVTLHRGSPQKARLVVDLIRGRRYDDARNQLSFSPKRAAVNILKALDAAEADARAAGADSGSLVVSEVRVDNGPHIKRFRPKDRGRAHPILKRTSHITVGLEERS